MAAMRISNRYSEGQSLHSTLGDPLVIKRNVKGERLAALTSVEVVLMEFAKGVTANAHTKRFS